MSDVKVNNTELEYLRLQRIRHELQDYRYYLLKKNWLNEKIAELDAKLDGHIPALKTGEGSGGSSTDGNWIISAIAEQDELVLLRGEVQRHIDGVEEWLTLVNAKLGDEFVQALNCYAIAEGYENVDKCVDILRLSNSKKLQRTIAKAENCILENMRSFKNC